MGPGVRGDLVAGFDRLADEGCTVVDAPVDCPRDEEGGVCVGSVERVN